MIHVAVLLRPYLDAILEGRKTLECRLTRTARAPFEAIEKDERIHFKESSGPYRATALVDHVMFLADLTPARVRALKRDYNDFILGEDDYWKGKLHSRYATLIWLRDVQPTDAGPKIRPLQGVAWLSLPDRPTPKRTRKAPPPLQEGGGGVGEGSRVARKREPRAADHSFGIPITAGNLKNSTLYVTGAIEHFPEDCFGGRTRAEAGRPVTLALRDGPTVETDIVAGRNLLRTRVWGGWYRRVGARAGDEVVFTSLGERVYAVGVERRSEN